MTPISDYDRAHPPVDYPIPLIVPTAPARASGAFMLLLGATLVWAAAIAFLATR